MSKADALLNEALERKKKAQKVVEDAEKTLQAAREQLKKQEESYQRSLEKHADAIASATYEPNDRSERAEWMLYYKALVEFKARNGTTHIPRTDTADYVTLYANEKKIDKNQLTPRRTMQLSRWTQAQRTANRKGTLQPFQKILLDRLDFIWIPKQGPTDSKWKVKFDQLKEFQKEHGHCNIPVGLGEDPNHLKRWCIVMRNQYRNRGIRRPSLTDERVQLLEEIGFEWGERQVPITFEQRYEELKAYRERFGHANVPWCWRENKPLANWVCFMREKYRDLQRKGKSKLITQEQIALLEGLGLQWNVDKGKYDRSGGLGSPSVLVLGATGPGAASQRHGDDDDDDNDDDDEGCNAE